MTAHHIGLLQGEVTRLQGELRDARVLLAARDKEIAQLKRVLLAVREEARIAVLVRDHEGAFAQ